jgi:hypothetical protein
MTFIKARLTGGVEWQYVTPEDTLTTSPKAAATFTSDEAQTFLGRAPHDFPEWECKVEEWDMQDWVDLQG